MFFEFIFFHSIVFRAIVSLVIALLVSLIMGHYTIRWLSNKNYIQSIRLDGPATHLIKRGTPTMGGLTVLFSVLISILLVSDLSNRYVWYVLFIFITYGILGLMDDFFKIKRKNTLGLNVIQKYFFQSLIVFILIIIIFILEFSVNDQGTMLLLNKVTSFTGIWSVILAYFVIISTSNAVNLSDGLDGLAIVPVVLLAMGLVVIAWLSSDIHIFKYFNVSYDTNVRELIIVCTAIIGSGLGFLWFNAYPAKIFMGDTGSLSLGGAIGTIFVLLHQEYLLLIMGGIFVIEALSVILQVCFFKIFGKRIFKMAPIHHHFELKGIPEATIVIRFWIISLVLVLIGLVILKIK